MELDFMIDLETLSTSDRGVILSIGIACIDLDTMTFVDGFYENLQVQPQLDLNRVIDGDTILWWMKQSDEARAAFDKGKHPAVVLNNIETFLEKCLKNTGKKKPMVWGNGSIFDITMLNSLYKDLGVKAPWKYSHVMDLRTFVRFNGTGKISRDTGVHHNALSDAINQSKYILDSLKSKLTNKK